MAHAVRNPRALKPLPPAVCAPRVLYPCGIPPGLQLRAETHLMSELFGVGSLDDTHSTAAYVQRHAVFLCALRSCLRAYEHPAASDPLLDARELVGLVPEARRRYGVSTRRARRFERTVLLRAMDQVGGGRSSSAAEATRRAEAAGRRAAAYAQQAEAAARRAEAIEAELRDTRRRLSDTRRRLGDALEQRAALCEATGAHLAAARARLEAAQARLALLM